MPPARPKRATLKDVARTLGVSVATVSNAYNRPDQINPQTRQRVLDTAHALGYTGPDPAARNLRRGRTGNIGVLYGDDLQYAFADPAAGLFLQGVAGAVQTERLNLTLLPAPNDARAVMTAAVDGFILYCAAGDPAMQAALNRPTPLVLVDHDGLGDDHPTVRIDDAGGAAAASAHLRTLGHTRAAVLAFPGEDATDSHPTRERLRGYAQHLPLGVHRAPRNTPKGGAAAAHALLSAPDRPTALLCMSDQIALGALSAARALGLRVPEDLSLLGFDDVPGAALAGLSTVHQDHAAKGRAAGELLLALLHGDPAPSPPTLPTHLELRLTTGPAPRTGG
ncbi:LacI family DNA-binding transcriptional regulator [Deinococcus maricopensis]|uniref:Transcriptional regulator, LacI family n=1 Tax=Deinococcus maricopensis (strain DSM 21211 / LMG 22137 / NRRL B-23946 / LB-34) TaxID=709986 RepID=E8UBD9_DEIML|nr:LacI family DNA-binding transcriptional regulator [Deinococcus maricopensis]ADV68378.1 transcriptional regulator, LacI family [Deinococcus maricopensis DSM 21211]